MKTNEVRAALDSRMFDNFNSVSEGRNIIFTHLQELNAPELTYVVGQYAQFPRNIVSILVSAAYNFGYHGWTALVKELRDNVFEELGGGCGDIAHEFGPHYSILRKELHNVFHIDIHAVTASGATERFLAAIKSIVQAEPIIAAGGVFALEASAVPELGIVMKLVSHLAQLNGTALTTNLSNFFKFHVNDIEVGHRDRLIQLIENQIADVDNFNKFVQGYDQLLGAMDQWWADLFLETKNLTNEPAVITN